MIVYRHQRLQLWCSWYSVTVCRDNKDLRTCAPPLTVGLTVLSLAFCPSGFKKVKLMNYCDQGVYLVQLLLVFLIF